MSPQERKPKATSTLERELQRVVKAKHAAYAARDREREDWLYGAEEALAWALGYPVASPMRAFADVEVQT